EMGLKDYEFAFYEAIAQNKSAKEVMSKRELKELAIAIFQTLRQNVSLDWQHKESVRAKLRVAVKRVLQKYGYPPDMQKLAVDRVIEQAELVASKLV
ncbi:type I restriction enzyme endonuclease domain-containing protein, partial [Helicobacter japonicus]